ncbi:hypothetical protein K456DRAFT_44162 [Colletotrichum gloeosporioides 23]|nr:hypothetical protein K456DRAFT_44162 [Colletotrichum gloeosporioides 23]
MSLKAVSKAKRLVWIARDAKLNSNVLLLGYVAGRLMCHLWSWTASYGQQETQHQRLLALAIREASIPAKAIPSKGEAVTGCGTAGQTRREKKTGFDITYSRNHPGSSAMRRFRG